MIFNPMVSGGGTTVAATPNEDGTQNLIISDDGSVIDLQTLTADADADAADIAAGKTAYVGGAKVTGEMVPTLLKTGTISGTQTDTITIEDMKGKSNIIISLQTSQIGSGDVIELSYNFMNIAYSIYYGSSYNRLGGHSTGIFDYTNGTITVPSRKWSGTYSYAAW